jgi:NADH-quinone oxidoreductase subunit L
MVLVGFYAAWVLYCKHPGLAAALAKKFKPLYSLLDHKYWMDEIYGMLIVAPLLGFARVILNGLVDTGILQGTASGLAGTTRAGGWIVRRVQSGNIRSYAGWLALGAASLIVIVLYYR